jgi:hypothetical protein
VTRRKRRRRMGKMTIMRKKYFLCQNERRPSKQR